MRFQIRRCTTCRAYTLEEACHTCGASTESPHPAKFSPDDKYMRYRLRAKYAAEREPGAGADDPAPGGDQD